MSKDAGGWEVYIGGVRAAQLWPRFSLPRGGDQTAAGTSLRTRHKHPGTHRVSIGSVLVDQEVSLRLQPIPDSFVCPLSGGVMADPVATVDGLVYDRVICYHMLVYVGMC